MTLANFGYCIYVFQQIKNIFGLLNLSAFDEGDSGKALCMLNYIWTSVFIMFYILLQYADGDEFTVSHMNAFDNACEDTLFRNISNYHHDNNGELVLMPNIVTVGCPNNCNRQGKCHHGACVCNHGFTSVDCSVPVGSSPVIDHITG